MRASRADAARAVAAEQSQETAGEHLARVGRRVRGSLWRKRPHDHSMNRPARSPKDQGGHGWIQEGGQRLGRRARHAHGGAAAARSGGWGGASMLRVGEGSASGHGEDRRANIWAIMAVRSEVRAGMNRRAGAFHGPQQPRQEHEPRACRERECRVRYRY
ncbi:uncharacterized protein M421DRAFT_128994 [Didymella exigua CBS 183.55]|uniref:Uncharacterized protein n=1 Tax=Didymella exigua CBS 183.55 TaxID=1150837 RepID=A0A6A5RRF8_9PLEO|nr:uncharacterized protein M421DRAFT_128994 [Didymella exigua CBS 183.55]KAF1929758.1 hypothetical protein M421DRAFT_128994 [Didymella exigua CBS 183.55]